MSSSGGKSSEQFSFGAPGRNASQSSPGSINDASSSETATVITVPSTSQASGNGRIAPLEATSSRPDARMGNARRAMKRFTRSTSPRTASRRSPKRDIEKTEIEDAKDYEEKEVRLLEELRSARVSYQHLNDEYTCLHDGHKRLYAESREEFSQMTKCSMAMNTHLQEMIQEDEGATIRLEELERKLRLAENHEEHSQFDEVKTKMEDMTSEMQSAFGFIQEQNQISGTYSRRAQHLSEENKAMMTVADELQARMLMLHDENSNMLEVAQERRERSNGERKCNSWR